jgi:hypothetical protein
MTRQRYYRSVLSPSEDRTQTTTRVTYSIQLLPFEDCPNVTARTHSQTTPAFYYSSIELVRRQVFSYMHCTSGLTAQYG